MDTNSHMLSNIMKAIKADQAMLTAEIVGENTGALKTVSKFSMTNSPYTSTPGGYFLIIEFEQEVSFNYIFVKLYEDTRIFTLTVESSIDQVNWQNIGYEVKAQGEWSRKLEPAHDARYLRFTGTSTLNNYLHLTSVIIKYLI